MKKHNTPPEPPDINPSTPFQNLGNLRILRGSIPLIYVMPWSVEMLHSSGVCITIPSAEIRKTRFQTNRGFADALELGGNFPSLRFTIRSMRNYKPEWLDPAPPRKISPAFAHAKKKMDGEGPAGADATGAQGNGSEGDSQPQQPAAPPVSLPLPPFIPPYFPRSGGGGHGR